MQAKILLYGFLLSLGTVYAGGTAADTVSSKKIEEDTVEKAKGDLGLYPCKPSTGKPIIWTPLSEGVKVGVTPYGYIKWEMYFDSRQVIGDRDEHVMTFPAPFLPDKYGCDSNKHGEWDMLAIETRIGWLFTGPTWGDIKTSAIIEGDFRGANEVSISNYRQRHAYGQITWPTGAFLFGQYWHPLFIVECFPYTVSFGTGVPVEPQAREPQLRLFQKFGSWEVIVAAAGQRDFGSNGPEGVSSIYLRNSLTPNAHFQVRKYFGEDNLIGAALDFKRLVPRLVSHKDVKVNEHIDSFVVEAFAALRWAPFSLRLKGIYAQNANDQLVLSGFAVHTVDPVTDFRTYTTIAGAGGWLDFTYKFWCDQMELGLFVGYIKNLGAQRSLFIDPTTGHPIIFSLTDVGKRCDYSFQAFPRYVFAKDPIRFAIEIEYARAAFGAPNRCGRIDHPIPVHVVRVLTALYYVF